MPKLLSIFQGRERMVINTDGSVITIFRKNPGFKFGPRKRHKTSVSNRRDFFSKHRVEEN